MFLTKITERGNRFFTGLVTRNQRIRLIMISTMKRGVCLTLVVV